MRRRNYRGNGKSGSIYDDHAFRCMRYKDSLDICRKIYISEQYVRAVFGLSGDVDYNYLRSCRICGGYLPTYKKGQRRARSDGDRAYLGRGVEAVI